MPEVNNITARLLIVSDDGLTATLPLRKPITFGEETTTSLSLREPTAGELESAQASASSNMGTSISLIAITSGIARPVAAKLCSRDFQEASEYLGNFTLEDVTPGVAPSPT